MNKKKGFTLIELLAIIVILAIIAVITVPIILNIIEESKKGAAKDSAYGYKDSINKYYTQQLLNNQNLKLNDTYTVTNGTLSGGDFGDSNVTSFPVQVSGTVPSSGELTYKNNVLTEGCLEINEYAVTLENETISKTEKGKCELKVDFKTDSWSKIIANLNKDRNAYDEEIGKTKIIEFDRDGNGINEYYKLRLANTAPCNGYTGSNTSCGVVIEFLTLIGNYNMFPGSDNYGGWKDSTMRLFLTNTILNKLPNDLQTVIIPTAPIVSGSGSSGKSDDVVVSENFEGDKLYLLSGKELGLDLPYDNKKADTETKILEYYVDKTTDNTSRKKYQATNQEGTDTVATGYWIRTAHNNSSTSFYYVDFSGSYNAYYSNNKNVGVAPAFRIFD